MHVDACLGDYHFFSKLNAELGTAGEFVDGNKLKSYVDVPLLCDISVGARALLIANASPENVNLPNNAGRGVHYPFFCHPLFKEHGCMCRIGGLCGTLLRVSSLGRIRFVCAANVFNGFPVECLA